MNFGEKLIVFQLAELGPCKFADLSIKTQTPTAYLNEMLESLTARGFIEEKGGVYSVPDYALAQIVPKSART